MSENAWVEHDGGECPVPHDARVEVQYRDGEVEVLRRADQAVAVGIHGSDWWKHEGECWHYEDGRTIVEHDADIIAYRLSGPSA